ncbi:MAG: phosphate propanoyltransferase [Candidatus Coatesbacteria bacterium]|nr:phosphate propanoyltransferase [Candidatus Coatesbacteria bacterium]
MTDNSDFSKKLKDIHVIVNVSARHVHLSKEDFESLFGIGKSLTKDFDLIQPGEFAAKERLTIAGQKGSIENVRILGPFRNKSQVEISLTDGRNLGIENLEVRISGDLDNTPSIVLIGKKGNIILENGVIAAKRHIHCSLKDAEKLNLKNGQLIWVRFEGEREGVLGGFVTRASGNSVLELHIDTDEANALGVKSGIYGLIADREEYFDNENSFQKDIVETPHLITELFLKKIKKKGMKIKLDKSCILTPMAKDFLKNNPEILRK